MSEAERLTAADMDAFEAACHLAFHEVPHPADIAMYQRVTDPERTVGVREDGELVATGCVMSRELTVPGATLPVAGVSGIVVCQWQGSPNMEYSSSDPKTIIPIPGGLGSSLFVNQPCPGLPHQSSP